MSDTQAIAPEQDNAIAAETAAKKETLLTDEGKSTTSLTEGATSKLPRAWMSGLTSEQQADADLIKTLSKFEKGIPDLSKAYVELERKQSQLISIPNEKATEEERARFYARIGRPEKSTDYKLDEVQLPEGLTVDEGMRKAYLEVAHKNGLSGPQANEVSKWYLKAYGEQVVAARKLVKITQEEAEEAARKELGANYEASKEYMDRGFRQFGTPETAKLFTDSGLGNHPQIRKMFTKIGKTISEHAFVDGSKVQMTEKDLAHILYPDQP